MTAVGVQPVSLPSGHFIMDDKKRPASYDQDEAAPPLKRQATTTATNGPTKTHQDLDIPGRDDLERFQKEAIYRQMQEYKREKIDLQEQLKALKDKSAYHDDHLRTIHTWFSQLLDELRLLTGDVTEQSVFSPFPSNLFTADSSSFDEHLKSRSAAIETTIRDIFSKAQNHKPEVVDFQERIAKLLLSEKEHIHKLQVAQSEYDDMQDRLSKATSRYLKAEKGIDRAKSRTVQKLERQAISGGRSETGSGLGGGADVKSESTNGQVNSEALVQAEIARKQTEAVAAKQQEQLQQLSTRNQELINQVAELKLKSSNNLDDQYAQTELFKQSKKQLEDSVNRINNLEATNADLRKEAKRLQAERAAYRTEVDAELNSSNAEKDMQLSKAESDLARIRTARDELYAELQVRKQAQDQEKTSVEHIKQIAAAKDDRILSLESEIERLRGVQEDDHASIADLPLEELQTKYAALEKQYSMMNQELAAMSSAYKKLSSNVSQKVTNLSDLEEKVARSTAEKSKADQKYFGAMKAKDAREQEVRTLRTQNSKTAEIVTQFKDVEAGHRELVVTLEKQVAESKDAFAILEAKHHVVQSQVSEKSSAVEVSRKQLDDAKAVMQERTKEAATVSDALRKAETEIEKLKVDIAEKDSRLETWRQTNTDTDEGKIVEALRGIAYCNICRNNLKEQSIKICGHTFCKPCIDDRLANRMRKCPICARPFGANDVLRITL